MQNNRWFQALIILLVIIAAIYLAGLVLSFVVQFSTVLLLFFLSWLLAFTLRPLARMLNSRGISYGLSVLIVYLGLAVGVALSGFLLVPVITQQVSQLSSNFEAYVADGQRLASQAQDLLLSWGVRAVDIEKFYGELAGQIQPIGMGVLTNVVSVLQGIATLVLQLVLVLILSFYFMKDGDRIFGGILQLLPPRWQDEGRLLALSIEKSFGAFVRGQILFAFIYALMTAAVMLAFRLDYVVIASIVAGLAMIIPLVGNFIAFAPPVLVCLVTPGREGDWLWVFLACFVVQAIQMNLIGPRIMSQAIGIHPLYVMAAMLIGGQVAGFWGALFGIPVAGTMNLMGRPMMRRIRYQSPLYKETQGAYLTTSSFATGPLRPSVPKSKVESPMSNVQSEIRNPKSEIRNPKSEIRNPKSEQTAVDEEAAQLQVVSSELLVGSQQLTTNNSQLTTQMPALDYDLDFDAPPPRQPTLSAKAWRLAWVFVSRAYTWIGVRAHIRTSRR